MKKIYGFLGALALLSMAACTADEPMVLGDSEDGDGRYAYINATIALPTAGSRSSTDDEGPTNSDGTNMAGDENLDDGRVEVSGNDYEYGYDYENDVRSMILVITDKEDRYFTHLVITGMTAASETGRDYTFQFTTRIPYGTIEEAYEEGGLFNEISKIQKPNVRVYAFCNFTQNMRTQFDNLQKSVVAKQPSDRDDALLKSWLDFHGSVEEKATMAGQTPMSTNSIWAPRSFLMSNATVYESTFPQSAEEWDPYADDRNPLNLTQEKGAIPVERVAARIDFRDASDNHDQIYKIWFDTSLFSEMNGVDDDVDNPNATAEGKLNLFSVKLSRMVLVNMSKNFWYLRRVSNDGTMNNAQTNGLAYAGKETPVNYVVDYDYTAKLNGDINPGNADEHFNFPLYDKTATNDNVIYNNMYGTYGWYISNINKEGDPNSVLKGKTDNWEGDHVQQYHIWRYVTENTIPSIDQQKTVQSTGVIFKAAILAGENAEESEYVSDDLVAALNAVNNNEEPTKKPTLPDGSALPAIYSFHNMMYGGVPDIVRAASRDGNGGSLYFAVDQILKNWYLTKTDTDKTFKYSENAPSGTEGTDWIRLNVTIADEILNGTPVTDDSYNFADGTFKINFKNDDAPESLAEFDNSRFIELAPEQQITVFIPTNDDTEGWGYYCYYFYWIRHNDNHLGGKMGTMEFATVRNNVYKLAVTKINSIGRPRDTTRDPDPVRPDDPDEEPERSIEVEINVLPWVVRVNDIEF